jgi:hypothetical protein
MQPSDQKNEGGAAGEKPVAPLVDTKLNGLQILPADVLLNAVGEANFAFVAQGAQALQDAATSQILIEGVTETPLLETLDATQAAEMAAARNAGDVDTLIPGSMMTDEEFNAFLAERGAVENLLNATNLGPITQIGGGRGVNDSLVYQLPDGRKFKVKPGSEAKGRNESAMHALYRLFGIQVTEGRLGLVQRGNEQKKLFS